MQKRLQHHKKKLMDLEQAQKTFFTSQFDSPSSSNTLLKQQEKQFRKELSQYATKVGVTKYFQNKIIQMSIDTIVYLNIAVETCYFGIFYPEYMIV